MVLMLRKVEVMKMLKMISALLIALVVNNSMAQSSVDDKTEVVFEKIADNVYVTTNNSGANVTILVAEQSILLIDTGSRRPGTAESLYAGIRAISDKKIQYVINTHYHFDHSGGNQFFANLGATIIGQEYIKYSPSLHHITFNKKMTLNFAGEEVNIYHTPGHTLDSSIVQLVNNNILLMGDSFSTEMITYEGASGKNGYDKLMQQVLSLTNDNSTIVPGHGVVSNISDLIKSHKTRDIYRKRLGALYAQGWSMESIFQDKTTKALISDFTKFYGHRLIPDMIEANFVKTASLPLNWLAKFSGRYQGADGLFTQIALIDGKLQMLREGSFVIELKPLSKNRFDLVGFPFVQEEQVSFTFSKNEQVDKMLLQIPNRFVLNSWIVEGESKKIM